MEREADLKKKDKYFTENINFDSSQFGNCYKFKETVEFVLEVD